jgi:hypothetical protein
MKTAGEVRRPKAEVRRKAENRSPKGPVAECQERSSYES